MRAIVIGAGATLLMDLWNQLLRRAFGVRSLDYCLLGRWIVHMPSGRFRHASIGVAERRRGECVAGWTAHYAIGVTLAVGFVGIVAYAAPGWIARPTLLPALAYGVVTVAFPFLVLQPAIGLGVASAKAAKPWAARVKSVGTHVVFGVGMWVTASLLMART